MKRTLLSAMLVLPLSIFAQNQFTVKGKLAKVKDGTKLYIAYPYNNQRVIDSAVVTNGSFEFKGAIENPTTAQLFKNVNPFVKGANTKNLDFAGFYIEPGTVTVTSVDSVKSLVAGGTAANIDNTKLKGMLTAISAKEKVLNDEYAKFTKEQKEDEAFMEAFYEKYDKVDNEKKPIYLEFIKQNPKSYISLVTLSGISGDDKIIDQTEKLYAALDPALKQSKIGASLPARFSSTRKTAIGVNAIEFTQNDVDGKPVKLSDFKGKYVLIDFWASWCGPCRGENPNVVAAFNKYKDKNFTILGVSLDGGDTRTTKEAWMKAIKDDGLNWTQVSDLKGWNNEVSREWGIFSIPANFLLDPSGKIIAKDLRGSKLHKKLEEVLTNRSK
ncbi:TlpA disulfide reductase family protein [Pedobacter montanisoli]|uniref:AhpC/TSA family protein n=1 Tax=Pedobacter montanisoli TaxID=2923277 RepID=A0ABS9ZV07_9SPHI|nr:TlpA disulfide reductase family protein [Pedobacter montanisoli]MCJ0742162.1 AhpC/TSA family protein [Pedobacter montanisoli]